MLQHVAKKENKQNSSTNANTDDNTNANDKNTSSDKKKESVDDELDFSNLDFGNDDDFNLDLDFEDEELADEKELADINDKKMKNQINPFGTDEQTDEKEEANIDDIYPLDDETKVDIIPSTADDDVDDEDHDVESEENKSDIIKMEEEIGNINVFIKHMEEKGYQLESSRFLTKKFAESTNKDVIYNVNVTIDEEVITAITSYDENNKIVTLPNSIIKVIKNDISESLKEYL